MIGKTAYLLAVVAAIVVVAEPAPGSLQRINPANKQSHDLFIGNPFYGDRLVANPQVLRQPVWNQVVTAYKTFSISHLQRITQVIARDQQMDGRGGYVGLVEGGPGNNNVTLYFWSQKGQAINFVIEIYAIERVLPATK